MRQQLKLLLLNMLLMHGLLVPLKPSQLLLLLLSLVVLLVLLLLKVARQQLSVDVVRRQGAGRADVVGLRSRDETAE